MDDSDQSCDLVNQITLNFLISKNQLQKLNKLRKKEDEDEETIDLHENKERILELFTKLLDNDPPDDLLEDVKGCFNSFVKKSVYYLEIHDKNVSIQEERNGKLKENQDDDIEDEEEEDEDEDEDGYEDQEPAIQVNKKYSKKQFVSGGVEDIQKLPLDWFNTTRQAYKTNQIIPRKKEIVIGSPNNLAEPKRII
jgi:hypothetical protein